MKELNDESTGADLGLAPNLGTVSAGPDPDPAPVPVPVPAPDPAPVPAPVPAPAPIEGAYSRIRMRVGDEGLQRLQGAKVVVVGLGAVGSFATEALARSAIGTLRLVDFDNLQPSNLNRQLYALKETMGCFKADVAAQRVKSINPACNVQGMRVFFDATQVDAVLEGMDWCVDAIDSLNSKVELLAACVARNIPVVSAMGAADRTDPMLLRISDISETDGCPLARLVRKRLRKRGVQSGPIAIWSTQPAVKVPPELQEEPDESADQGRRGRIRRPLPSLAPMPGIFGLAAANVVIMDIVGGRKTPS
ncbi:MAG TPA: tRNA threonylcarbamoyladenosine dehydratase [Myxococcota bacterium]|nr:tRNA threonylcarbamoyladenosine dehydratase [Myxococcota bacterium]